MQKEKKIYIYIGLKYYKYIENKIVRNKRLLCLIVHENVMNLKGINYAYFYFIKLIMVTSYNFNILIYKKIN